MKLELQVQPSIHPRPNPYGAHSQQNVVLVSPSTTPIPAPLETVQPQINPAMADAIYQQHQINLNPSYSPLRDQDIIDPLIANAILQQQFLSPQSPDNIYGLRQNADGSVSTSQNRPPFFNWFGNGNNNNNQQQQQPGPIIGFLTNLAQNNPFANFLNQFQPQQQQQQLQQQSDQPQNPFQTFVSNLNPLNLFSNQNNRPQQVQPIQSDYFPQTNPSNQILSGNVDQSVFSNDHFLNPNQFPQNSAYGNQGLQNTIQSMNYNPGFSNPSPLYNPTSYQFTTNRRPGFTSQFPSGAQPFSQFANHANGVQHYSQFTNQAQPYPQLLLQSPIQNSSPYPFQNPNQSISPVALSLNPNYQHKKKTGSKSTKKKNDKNKVDLPDNDSDWFQDFLDKRKSANLDISSRRSTKKSSDEDDDDMFDEYFR